MADGVDGELITWDASGVIATVAVGSVGEVLTSGGVGVAPTFQAGAGGGANTALSNLAATAVNATINMNSNILDNFSRLQSDAATLPATGVIRLGNAEIFAWATSGGAIASVTLDAGDKYVFAVGGTTVLTANTSEVTSQGNSIRVGGGSFILDKSAQNIRSDGGVTMQFNMDTGEDYDFRINSVVQLGITTSALTLRDTVDLVVGTGTGTEIATAVGQKLGFWGSTPLVQQSVGADTLANLYTLLRAIGIVA